MRFISICISDDSLQIDTLVNGQNIIVPEGLLLGNSLVAAYLELECFGVNCISDPFCNLLLEAGHIICVNMSCHIA